MTSGSLCAAEFFDMVDRLLVPPMAELGFHRIGGSVNEQPASRGLLATHGSGASGPGPFLWYDYGFEAGSDDVQRLVAPTDPVSQDEWWLHHEPATGRLQLTAWHLVARHPVDWDVRTDDGPCTPSEVERRLAALGRAVLVFVDDRGGHSVG